MTITRSQILLSRHTMRTGGGQYSDSIVFMSQDIINKYWDNFDGYSEYLKNIKNKYLEAPITVNSKVALSAKKIGNTRYWAVYRTTGSLATESSSFSCRLSKIPKKFIISTYYNTVNDRDFGYKYKTVLKYPETYQNEFIIHRVHPYYNSLLFEVNGKREYLMKDFPSYIDTTYDFETNISNLEQKCSFAYYDENYMVNNKYPTRVYFSHFELIF